MIFNGRIRVCYSVFRHRLELSKKKKKPIPMSHTEPYEFCNVLSESVHESEKNYLFGTDRDQSILITFTLKYS